MATSEKTDGRVHRPQQRPHRRLGEWEVESAAKADIYWDEILELQTEQRLSYAEWSVILDAAAAHLKDAARVQSQHRTLPERLVEYWTGSAREEAWRAIHEADVVLTYARPAEHLWAELPGLKQKVRLRVDDPVYQDDLRKRLEAIERRLDEAAAGAKRISSRPSQPRKEPRVDDGRAKDGSPSSRPSGTEGAEVSPQTPSGVRSKTSAEGEPATNGLFISDADRTAIAHIKQELSELNAASFESQRRLRNVLILTTFACTAAAALLAVLGLQNKWITWRLDIYPNSGRNLWPETIWPLELVGSLAGLMVGITALRRLAGRGPFSLRAWQAMLKVPAGALTAVTGMLVLQSGFFGIGPATTKHEFLGWLIVFGASQEFITRLVDQKAAEVVKKVSPET